MKWNNYLRWKDSDIWLHENFDRLNIMNLNTCRTHIFMWTDKIQDPDSGYDVIQSFKVFNQLNIIKHRILTWCGQSEGKVTWWFGLERNTGWGLTPKRGLKRFPRPPPQPVYLSGSSGLEPPVLPKIRCGQGEKRATSWSTRQPESQRSRTLTFSDRVLLLLLLHCISFILWTIFLCSWKNFISQNRTVTFSNRSFAAVVTSGNFFKVMWFCVDLQ